VLFETVISHYSGEGSKVNRKIVLLVYALVLLLSYIGISFQFIKPVTATTTWTVDDDGPADFSSIQEAVNAATDGDTIIVRTGIYYENVVVNETISLIGENRMNTIIDGNHTSDVMHVTANNVNITGFTFRNSGPSGGNHGIELRSTFNNNIFDNIVLENYAGIVLYDSDYNNVFGNTVLDNYGQGVLVYFRSEQNNISRNILSNNGNGIGLYSDRYINYISGNTIIHNDVGLFLYLLSLVYNKVYHNNFINNSIQAIDPWRPDSPHVFDNGYPSGGNYWSDYTGNDTYSGPYQNETGSDGIGDVPHTFPDFPGGQDRYPLMTPWKPSPWPMFQHDAQHTGRSNYIGPETNPEAHILIEGEGENDYFNPPVVGSDDTLYLATRITEGGSTRQGLLALNHDGTQKWFYEIAIPGSMPAMSALWEVGYAVYFLSYGTEFGGVSAVNTETGDLKWRRSFAALYGDQFPVVGENGMLYFIAGCILPDESFDSCLLAFHGDGEIAWAYAIENDETYYDFHLSSEGLAGFSSSGPTSAVTIDREGTIYVGFNDTLFAMNSDGSEKWRRVFVGEYEYMPSVPKPRTPSITDDGTIYIVVRNERDYRTLQDQGFIHVLHALDPEDPQQDKWVWGTTRSIEGPPSISHEGNIYISGGVAPIGQWISYLYGFDSEGNTLENWGFSVGYTPVGLIALDSRENVYCITSNGARAYSNTGVEKWSLITGRRRYVYTPSLGKDGTLYVPSRQGLYAIRSPIQARDFSITASPTSLTIPQGNSDTSTITVTFINGFNQPVQLSISGEPSGVTTTLNPEQVTPPADSSSTSTLTVSVDTTAMPGSYTLNVTGTSDTVIRDMDITLEIVAAPPSERYKPKLSIPIHTPDKQTAHQGTELTFIVKVTNEGEETDTIDLSPSPKFGWYIELSETSVTLEPQESKDVYLKVTVETTHPNPITIIGVSQGDPSKTSSCQVTATGWSEFGLFTVIFGFSNKDIQPHTLGFDVPDWAKISDWSVTLAPSEDEEVTVVFDPNQSEDLDNTRIITIDHTTIEGAIIPIDFQAYEIIATEFDVADDSYNFPNGIYSTETCYGMAATAILYFNNPLLLYQKYGKFSTYELTKEEAKGEILHHQGDVINNKLVLTLALPGSPNEEAEYKRLEGNIQKNNPMVLALQFKEELFGKEWHAVVAYKIAEKDDEAYILVYDNELPYVSMSDIVPFRYATYNLVTHELYYYGQKCEFLVYEPKEDIISQPLPRVASWVGQISSWIRSGLNMIFDCPVNITITDQYGRVVSDTGINQIPSATVASTNETKYFCLPLDLIYNVSISACDVGNFNLMVVRPIADSNAAIDMYEGISVISGTQAILEIIPYQMNQTMKIDIEGDGVVDELKDPSVSEIVSIALPSAISPVGGAWVPINKFQLLAPWIGLASLMIVSAASIAYVKHRKKQQD